MFVSFTVFSSFTSPPLNFFKNFIGVKLICNAVLVSNVQQTESDTHTHTHTHTHIYIYSFFKKDSFPICCCCLVAKSYPTLCNSMDRSTPGFPVLHCLQEFAQTHVQSVSGAIQSSHFLLPSFSPALNLSQHQGLFQ